MNPAAYSLLGLCAAATLLLPRKWAFFAFMAGVCYLNTGPAIDLGVFSFNALRVLISAAAFRFLLRGRILPRNMVSLDWILVAWAVWAAFSSTFHQDPGGDLVTKLGIIYDVGGLYFVARHFIASIHELAEACRLCIVVLMPIATAMLYENITQHNLFAVFGGVPDTPMIRDGRTRAFGPYTHPILAGTVGAVTLPIAAGLWRYRRRSAVIGAATSLVMIACSGSSGPVMSGAAGVAALLAWRTRRWMRHLRWGAVFAYIVLDLIMIDPAYYIIARLDVTGSSTGWHRAALIEASLAHLGEWYLAGTDYTRHWMPTGVSWSPNHTDITNYYLHMGVMGGLPLTLLFVAMLAAAFSYVGRLLNSARPMPVREQRLLWGLGSALFAQAATCVSVSYFDQSVMFLYLNIAAIGSVYSARAGANRKQSVPAEGSDDLEASSVSAARTVWC